MQPSRRKLNRSMGNAQSRTTSLGRAPQYGATSNVNGAQTAGRTAIYRQRGGRIGPDDINGAQRDTRFSENRDLGEYGRWSGQTDDGGPSVLGNWGSNPDVYWSGQKQPAPQQAPQQIPPDESNGIFGKTSAYDPNRQPPAGVSPQNPAWMASRREAARMNPGQPAPAPQASALGSGRGATGSWGDPAPQVPAAPPAPAPYAGGDVAGQAQYYRNTALAQYNPPIAQNLPSNSFAQSQSVGAVTGSSAPQDVKDEQYGQLNGYDTFTSGMNDPNRPTPNQNFRSAIGAGQGNEGGNRFAGAAGRVQAGQQSDRAAVAAGTQANRQRMEGIANNSPERAMDPESADTAFSYENAQGEMVNTNRLGMLQQMQRANPDDPQIAIKIAEEKIRQSGLGQKQEDQLERRRAASKDGLTDRQRRRLGYKNQVANNAMVKGILPQAADPGRPGFSHQERIARNNQMAADKSAFRASETALSRARTDSENAKELKSALGRDNQRLPNGQLRDAARVVAREEVNALVDRNFAGSSTDIFHGQVVRATGLTGDMADSTPMGDANKIFSKGIDNIDAALAFQRYWRGMLRSDADWLNKAFPGGVPDNSPVGQRVAFMNEMAQVPPELLPQWMADNAQRLAALRSAPVATPRISADSVDSPSFGSW